MEPHSIALAIVAYAWIAKVSAPPTVVNIVAWVVSVIVTAVFLLHALPIR